MAITVFPGETYRAPETWARRAYRNLIYFNEVDKGGHFAAWEQPELFSAELRAAFRPLRQISEAQMAARTFNSQQAKPRGDRHEQHTLTHSENRNRSSRNADARHEARGRRHPRFGRRHAPSSFYGGLGWRLDGDFVVGDTFRGDAVHASGLAGLDPFGTGITSAAPGSASGLYLVVSDIEAARAELIGRGVEVSEVFHRAGPGKPAVSGRHPERQSYSSYATFKDPDGNEWLLQEVTTRLPGRVDSNDHELHFRAGPCGRNAARGVSPRRAREAQRRPARRELAGLVRRVHGGGAGRQAAAALTNSARALCPLLCARQFRSYPKASSMKTNKLLVAAVLAMAIGAPIAGFVGDTNMARPITSKQAEVPFLHGLSAGAVAGQSELASLERADEWLNSPPLTASALRGKVVLIDFWTYTCINWLRTLPYVRAWDKKYRDQGLVVIGVHSPEFSFEKT